MGRENDYSSAGVPEMEVAQQSGWDMFTPEVSWFIYDFFKFDLNGYEKLIFYCYYIQGKTLVEIGDSACCTFQNIGATIKKIEKKLSYRWKNKGTWKVKHDSNK
jgi:hypothetical protein